VTGRAARPLWWLRGLTIDLRSLALFRMALGLCLLTDLLARVPQIRAFYTDDGVLPRAVVIRLGNPWKLSLHMISGEVAIQLGLFLIAIALATGFVVGYRTRLCAIASWVLLMSMHVRNPMVAHGGDTLMRLLLFWSMFVPLNARWSLDRLLNPSVTPLPTTHLSPAGMALLFQVCTVYWAAFAEKMDPAWVTERTAVYYALNLEMFARPLGTSLLAYPGLLAFLTTATLALELFGPIIAILPFRTSVNRLIAVGGFIGFHAGLAAALRLGTFSWIAMAAWTVFLPAAFWEATSRRLPQVGRWAEAAGARVARALQGRLVAPPPRPPGTMVNLATLGALSLVVLSVWSRPALRPFHLRTETDYRDTIFGLTGLGQRWRMFAPRPSEDDGWFMTEGVRKDGSLVDVWTGASPTEAKPADFAKAYRSIQWLSFLGLANNPMFSPVRPYLGDYFCRQWNRAHPDSGAIQKLTLYFMLEKTPPPGAPPPRPEKVRSWRQDCP
jgi:hypothetical protein